MHFKRPNVVVIGGGTGSFHMLSALKEHNINLTALVNMADNGGSSGKLRDELDVLPPGDVRQCLVALSTAPEELRALFNYRFPTGGLAGHSFGNLFLSAVENMTSNFDDAVRLASDVLRIQGRVLPITLDKCNLVLDTPNGKVVGEYKISYETDFETRPILSLEPKATITNDARQAILHADLVVIAPGNLYGSLVPALLVGGVPDALRQTHAKVAFVCNMINKSTHTRGYSVLDYTDEIERFTGDGVLNYVLYNETPFPPDMAAAYAQKGEFPVAADTGQFMRANFTAIGGDFLAKSAPRHSQNENSGITRSLVRHDNEAIARALLKLTQS